MLRLGCAILAAACFAFAAPRAGAEPASALAPKLAAGGRAVVTFQRFATDPFEGRVVVDPGTLVLEAGLADVRFGRTGERLTVRPDGGEWLQPALRQLMVMEAAQVASARQWWEAVLADAGKNPNVVREAARRYVVLGPVRSGARDTARVELDRAGLPARLTIVDDSGRSEYRFGRWRFERARGRAAFLQRAAKGILVVKLR